VAGATDACRTLSGTLDHQVYEEEVDPKRPFAEAIPHVWSWPDAVPALIQARSLLGKTEWASLVTAAVERVTQKTAGSHGRRTRR